MLQASKFIRPSSRFLHDEKNSSSKDWSPGWQFPAAELDSVKATLQKPGVLTAAFNYCRHMFGAFELDATLANIDERRWSEFYSGTDALYSRR